MHWTTKLRYYISLQGLRLLEQEIATPVSSFCLVSTVTKFHTVSQGLFYVIDGILDISLPLDEDMPAKGMRADPEHLSPSNPQGVTAPDATRLNRRASTRRGSSSARGRPISKKSSDERRRYLFTVKPGGIAGYMCSSALFHRLVRTINLHTLSPSVFMRNPLVC